MVQLARNLLNYCAYPFRECYVNPSERCERSPVPGKSPFGSAGAYPRLSAKGVERITGLMSPSRYRSRLRSVGRVFGWICMRGDEWIGFYTRTMAATLPCQLL